MRFETDNEATVAFRAETAFVAGYPVNTLRWADNYAITLRCREPIRAVVWDNGRNGQA